MPRGQTPTERFLEKGNLVETGCIEWQSTMHRNGYGKFWYEGETQLAHRVCHVLFKGPIPEGLHVLHKCDNRKCVNPEHLYAGTPRENVIDKIERFQGTYHGMAKMSFEEVQEARELYKTGLSQQKIADKYGVCQTTISCYILGKIRTKA